MAKIISLINMKGGVGKTTLSIGLADFLPSLGHKVLIIDADPQFNATQALLDAYAPKNGHINQDDEHYYKKEVLNKERTIYKLFRPQTNMLDAYNTPSDTDLIINLKENLDILCGDLNLVLVNKVSDHTFVKRIKNFIEDNDLKNKYDFIIIDCPPTLTIYTDSALMASDFYLIPNRIDRYSIVGIDSLQKAVKNLIREERIGLKCLGLIYTMVDPYNPVKQEKLKINFESKASVCEIDIFAAQSTIVNDIQRGITGTLPTMYKASREDIEAISLELIDKLEIGEV